MTQIQHANIYKIYDYSQHLKDLTDEDKISRFGYLINNHSIDQLILSMCYHHKDHELWFVEIDDRRVGWGHMARNDDGSWEIAVSVDKKYQRQGIGNKLITEMIAWSKYHQISKVYMHCIEDNRVIQHLAGKHDLETRYRSNGERTALIEVSDPTILELADQKLKEQSEIIKEIRGLQKRLTKLWLPV